MPAIATSNVRNHIHTVLSDLGFATVNDIANYGKTYSREYIYTALSVLRKEGIVDHRARGNRTRCYEYFLTSTPMKSNTVRLAEQPTNTEIQSLFAQIQSAFTALQTKLNQAPDLSAVSNEQLMAELRSRMS